MPREIITTDRIAPSVGPFSAAVRAGDLLFLSGQVALDPGTGTLVGRVALEGRSVQIPDAWTDPQYEAKEDARVGAIHTLLGVPLLRDGAPIGVIGLGRQKIEPFTDRQIELVSTFADQASVSGDTVTFEHCIDSYRHLQGGEAAVPSA